MIVLAIDPGLEGAMALLAADRAQVFDLPTVPTEDGSSIKNRIHAPGLRDLVLANCQGDEVFAVLEGIAAGGMGRGNAMSVGSQYESHGAIRATLELVGLDIHVVSVQRWKRFYGLTSEKGNSLETARTLYSGLEPDLRRKKDHNRAEAVLIGHWARKVLL